MEKLSINTSKKALLAVALVIFMLVAFLGLAVLTSNAAFASATDIAIGAVFTDAELTPHTDSSTTVYYYNNGDATNHEGDLVLTAAAAADEDWFDVKYSFTMNSNTIDGYQIKLNSTGFKVIGITVGETVLNAGNSYRATVSGVDYMATNGFQSGSTANLLITTTANITTLPDITVRYALTSSIAVFHSASIGMTSRYHVAGGTYVTANSSRVEVVVRSAIDAITAGDDESKTYDAQPAALSGAGVTWCDTPDEEDDADAYTHPAAISTSWAGSADAPIDAGSYAVVYSAAQNRYFEGDSNGYTYVISPKAVTITADDKSSVYLSGSAELSYTASPAIYGRDTISVTYTGAGASITTATTVGDYTITPVPAAHNNYSFTPANGTYTVTRHNVDLPTVTIFNNGTTTGTTITAGTTVEKNYNGKEYSFNYAAAVADANSIVPYTAAGGAAKTTHGTTTLTLSVNANYYWGDAGVAVGSQDTDAKTFTIQINKIPVTVTYGHADITYRDAVPTTGYTITASPAGGETVNAGISGINQAHFTTTYTQFDPVGTYDIELTGDSLAALETLLDNYNITYVTEKVLTVNKYALSADAGWVAYAAGTGTYTYDAAAHGIVAVNTAYNFGSTEVCSVVLTGGDNSNGSQTHVSGEEAAVTLTATFALKTSTNDDKGNLITDNYSLDNKVVTKDVTITRKAINVTANAKTITYGDAFANDGVSYGTFAGEETSEVLTGTLAYSTDYVAEAENAKRVVGTYYIRPSGLSNNDYAITYVDGVLTVGKKTVSITWSTPNTWIYDGSSHIVTATIGDTEYDEEIEADAYNTDTALTNVGSSSRSVTSLTDDANYAIPENSQAFSVTVRTVTVAVTPASNFTYDSASHTIFTVAVSNLVGTESLTFAYTETGHDASGSSAVYKNGSYTFAGEWADTYTLVFTGISAGVAGDSQTAGAATNYTLSADEEKSMTIAQYQYVFGGFSYNDANTTAAVVSWTAFSDLYSDGITITYTVKKGDVAQDNTSTGFTTTASGSYTLYFAISDNGDDRADNYAAIAAAPMKTLYVIELNDDDWEDTTDGHPHHGSAHADIFIYAFAEQTLPVQTAWTEAGYAFDGWFYGESQFANAGAAVSADATYTAKWHVVTFNVTYKYKLEGADSWQTYMTDVVTTYYTALETVPTKVWFSNVGWNDAETMDGNVKTILDYTSDRTYYTVYSYAIGNGDVNGDGEVTLDDATLIREVIVGGYAITSNIKANIAAAWEVSDAGQTNAHTYFLVPSTDVDGDGELGSFDVTALNRAVAGGYTDFVRANGNKEVVKKLTTTDDKSFTVGTGLTAGTTLKVYVDGAAVEYEYEEGVVTLGSALTSGKTVVIVTKRDCEAGDWSIALTDNWVKSTFTK